MFLALLVTLGLSGAAQDVSSLPTAVLDLATYPLTEDGAAKRLGPSSSRVSSIAPARSVALKVSLAALDRYDYATSDPLIYEVLIENVGDSPFRLPWSPVQAVVDDEDREHVRGYLEATVSLEVGDSGSNQLLARFDPQPLFGSERHADTLVVLQPGQSALVRVPTFVRFSSEQETEAALNNRAGHVSVRAVLRVLGYKPITSTNAVPVTLADSRR
jgi:hypothetical protein